MALVGLSGCTPAAYAAWSVAAPATEPAAPQGTVDTLEEIFLAYGYAKFPPNSGSLLASYWLRSHSSITVDIRDGSGDSSVLVVLSESGVNEFSLIGRREATLITDQLIKAFGFDRVTSCKALGLSGCVA